MESPDLPPTRLKRAQQKIADLLALRQGAATGLVAYSGSAHLVLPPTADADVVRTMALGLSPGVMPRNGDHLADAILLASQILADENRGGTIVILADTVAPDQVAALHALSAEKWPPIVFLAMVPPAWADADAALQGAVAALGSRLVAVTPDRSDVSMIARRLAEADRLKDVAGQGEHWRDFGYWLTPLLALLILAGFRRGWLVFG